MNAVSQSKPDDDLPDRPRTGGMKNPVPFRDALAAWAKIGLLSFGGPAGQIALMHRIVVDEKGWLGERQFLAALNFCMLLPGPEAMQLATYTGWRLHGVAGGLAAGLLFVVPGALVVLVLSLLYAVLGGVPVVEALFVGIKAAVLAIVLQALIKVAGRALKGAADWLIAVGAFVAIFMFKVPFPLIIGVAALIGFVMGVRRLGAGDDAGDALDPEPVRLMQTLKTTAVWLAIWLVPLLSLTVVAGPDHVLSQVGWFFSKLAVVTFGGAYAVLAYMAQEAVQNYGWLAPGEMLDGLGLAETTPGPLILVTEFVGFQAGWRDGAGANLGMALAASLVTLWATFAPCFLWMFAGAPYVERLNRAPRLSAALGAVTAAVVGVIANLSIWFGLNVLFRSHHKIDNGLLDFSVPDLASISLVAAGLSVLAVFVLFVGKRGVVTTLAICGAAAAVLHATGFT